MAQVDKIKVGGTTYNVSASPDGTNAFTSADVAQGSATAWTGVNQLTSGETNKSIFNKVSTMFKNIRYLYNVLGTGFSTSNTVTTQMGNKMGKSDKLAISQIPTSSSQINSTAYVPTSSLIWSMNETLKSLNDAIDSIDQQVNNPNDRQYEPRLIVTLSSVGDVNNFCNRYNRANSYKVSDSDRLAIGNEIQINNDGYNQRWVIAGFDLEHNRMASDSTTYDNGFGIFLVPKTQLTTHAWNSNNSTNGGYMNSEIHTFVNGTVATNLRKVLGSHLINRRVLLSNSTNGNNSNAYKWTNAYCTLMSIGQMTGEFGKNSNQFDDGEANYKLPVFNHMDKKTGSYFWSRGINSSSRAWRVRDVGSIGSYDAAGSHGVRPLIMIR